ncbi:MAG TPA: serine hydrolase domain-containing protein [Sphingomonas sp.]|nr:serine hydrolase domain-containing protein [Sphingomonas sp.]
MRRVVSGSAVIALVLGAGAWGGQALPQVAPAPVTSSIASPLPTTQALFDGYVRDNKMPGIVGAFGVGDGPTIFVSAGKIADDASAAPADPDSLWRVYSMTKPITAMAAMILIERGKMKLDQPVSDFIPGFAHMNVLTDPEHSLATKPAEHPVTIRNLLTHTAGLGYNIITKGPLLAEYNRLGINPAQVNQQLEGQARAVRPKTLQEFAAKVATLPLIAEPGTKWSYSIGLDVMGAVIEKASGMSFDGFVQANIFDPLKMRASYWTVPKSEVGRFATNYMYMREAMAALGRPADPATIPETARMPLDPAATSIWLTPPSFPYGGAGLVMSARDYDRFLHALQNYGTLDGVRVLKPETAHLMMSNLLPAGVTFGGVAATTGGTTAGPKMGFGAGGSVYLEDAPGGGSKGTYGWGGAAGTIAYVDPVRHIRGTVMVNYFPGERWGLRSQVVPALFADAARMTRAQ